MLYDPAGMGIKKARIRKAKDHLELNLVSDVKGNKTGFYK